MGEILVAQGKTTKECRSGLERTTGTRPRENDIQGIILLSDETTSAFKNEVT